LIELGPRMHGDLGPLIIEKQSSLEDSLHFRLADVFVNRSRYFQKKHERFLLGEPPFEIRHHSVCLDMRCRDSGYLRKPMEQTAGRYLHELSSFFVAEYKYSPGDFVRETVNFSTVPFTVVFLGTREEIQKDYERTKYLEREKFHDLVAFEHKYETETTTDTSSESSHL